MHLNHALGINARRGYGELKAKRSEPGHLGASPSGSPPRLRRRIRRSSSASAQPDVWESRLRRVEMEGRDLSDRAVTVSVEEPVQLEGHRHYRLEVVRINTDARASSLARIGGHVEFIAWRARRAAVESSISSTAVWVCWSGVSPSPSISWASPWAPRMPSCMRRRLIRSVMT